MNEVSMSFKRKTRQFVYTYYTLSNYTIKVYMNIV